MWGALPGQFGDGTEMKSIVLILILTSAAALGAYLLLLWFRRIRRPILVAVHLMLGVGGTETLIMFVHNSDFAPDSLARRLALVAAAFLGVAIFSGFTAPLFGRNYRAANAMLAAHVSCGVAGFLIALGFVSQL